MPCCINRSWLPVRLTLLALRHYVVRMAVAGSIPVEWISGTGLKSLGVLALFNNSLQGAMLLTVNGIAFQYFIPTVELTQLR